MIDQPSTPTKVRRISPINATQMNIIFQSTNGSQVTININSEGNNSYTSTGSSQGVIVTSSSIASSIVINGDGGTGVGGMPLAVFYMITIQDISPTLDFIAVTRTYSANSPIVLRLPPVTAHKRPIFIKQARNAGTTANDGVFIMTRGDSFIEFATRDTETIGGTTFNHSSSVFIGGQASSGGNVNYACITLFSDGSNWYIANYYPMHTFVSNNQFSLWSVSESPTGNNLVTGNASGVNIFKNNLAGRESGSNMVLLPTPTSSSICMVVYGGNVGTRESSNPLLIKDMRSGSFIDGFSSGSPVIYSSGDSTEGNAKSTGIVLFYDITGAGKWYVIGWYYPLNWTWGNSPTTPSGYGSIQGDATMKDSVTPAGQERKVLVTPDLNVAKFYTLPLETASNPQVIIFKARDITGTNLGLRYSTQSGGTTNSNRINENTISIKYGPTDSSSSTSKYSCVWFVSEQVSGQTYLRYYPVIAYVPNP